MEIMKSSLGKHHEITWLDLFINPRKFFYNLIQVPKIWAPFFIILFSMGLMYVALLPDILEIITDKLTGIEVTNRIKGLLYFLVSIFFVFQSIISFFLGSLIMHVIVKLLGAQGTLRQSTSLFITVNIPSAIKSVLIVLATFLSGEEFTKYLKSIFVEKDFILVLIDPFALWTAVLTVLALMIIHKLSLLKSIIVSGILFFAKIFVFLM